MQAALLYQKSMALCEHPWKTSSTPLGLGVRTSSTSVPSTTYTHPHVRTSYTFAPPTRSHHLHVRTSSTFAPPARLHHLQTSKSLPFPAPSASVCDLAASIRRLTQQARAMARACILTCPHPPLFCVYGCVCVGRGGRGMHAYACAASLWDGWGE